LKTLSQTGESTGEGDLVSLWKLSIALRLISGDRLEDVGPLKTLSGEYTGEGDLVSLWKLSLALRVISGDRLEDFGPLKTQSGEFNPELDSLAGPPTTVRLEEEPSPMGPVKPVSSSSWIPCALHKSEISPVGLVKPAFSQS
jgi:hypothetical protein